MNIGIFDSGLGGLVIAKALTRHLPEYNYIYLGDTKRVPYGTRSQSAILEFTKQGLDFLFQHNCDLVIVACNTSSAQALRIIQQKYLPKKYPEKKVLGVIIPAAELAANDPTIKKIGVIATEATVKSKSFERELRKNGFKGKIYQQPAPLLVPLIENGREDLYLKVLKGYLKPLQEQGINGIILGCTHYPIVKNQIKKILGSKVKIFSQDEIIPAKLESYLVGHPEIKNKLGKNAHREFYLTDITDPAKKLCRQWFGPSAKLKIAEIDKK